MKEIMDSTPASQPNEQERQESFANRKLIRPTLPRNDHNHGNNSSGHGQAAERRERPERHERSGGRPMGGGEGRKSAPPEQTNAENFYYQKQMQSKTLMVVVLRDGEEVRGIIEWYDRSCIKVNRDNGPNLMIYKPAIKYMYKEGENAR
jgi:host factor-I protein